MTTENQLQAIANILGNTKPSINKRSKGKLHRHIWSIAEENLAIDLYLNKASDAIITEAIQGTEVQFASMKMKLMNVQFLDIGKGLEKSSNSLKILWNKRTNALTQQAISC